MGAANSNDRRNEIPVNSSPIVPVETTTTTTAESKQQETSNHQEEVAITEQASKEQEEPYPSLQELIRLEIESDLVSLSAPESTSTQATPTTSSVSGDASSIVVVGQAAEEKDQAAEEKERNDTQSRLVTPSTETKKGVRAARAKSTKGIFPMSAANEKNITDHDAAMHFLFFMNQQYGNNAGVWPSNLKSFNKFITTHAKKANHTDDLAIWTRHKQRGGSEIWYIRDSLLQPLIRMGAVTKDKKKRVTWNREEVKKILKRIRSSENSDDGSNDNALPTATHSSGEKVTVAKGVSLVETVQQLETLKETFPFDNSNATNTKAIVAVDCEGVPDNLFLVQVGTLDCTFVFDCVKLGPQVVCEFLRDLLRNENVTKLFHDLHNDAAAFASIGGIDPLVGTLDTQLAMECLTGHPYLGFNQLMKDLGQTQHDSKRNMKERMKNGEIFAQRPLPRDVLQYAVDDVRLLVGASESLCEKLGERWNAVQRASDLRARMAVTSGGARQICFDVPNEYTIASYELLFVLRPHDMLAPTPLEVSNETETLIGMLPEDLSCDLGEHTRVLSDVVLDKGRRPHAWIDGSRLMLGDENRLVEQDEIQGIVEKLGGFGSDNRAGLERQLHRISAIRNRESEIIGLTLRFGRHVSGNTGIISDLLFGDTSKSILFLGEPGAGKTTVVREVTRLLAERSNVCIVDTSNEIAGDGDIPHPCVGFARRMMVPSLDKQSAVMIECVQNHTPEVMIIDEIGRPTEVEAARTCKNRGVRLIASAHGDLRKLIKNPKLRGLIGGVETVTLGDMQAKAEAKKTPGGAIQKTKAERAGPPTFDILVELKRGAHHEWRIVLDTGDAVDRVLKGEQYKAQRRTRNPETGSIQLALEMA